jgi:hypothetical protein
MRRGTLIAIILLFVVLAIAAVRELTIATSGHAPYPGPTVTNQLPEPSGSLPPTTPNAAASS